MKTDTKDKILAGLSKISQAAAEKILADLPTGEKADANDNEVREAVENRLRLYAIDNDAKEEVTVKAKRDLQVDGKTVSKDSTIKITRKQFNALSRFLELVSVIALLLCATVASAQQYTVKSLLGGTNGLAIATGGTAFVDTAVTGVITSTKSRFIGLQISFTNANATTFSSNVVFSFAKSIDGTNYDGTNTASLINVTVPSRTDTALAQLTTNITLDAVGYLKLISRTNLCTNVITNVTIRYVDASSKP